MPAGGREYRNEAQLDLRLADLVPGNPDAVRRAELGRAVMFRELLWCVRELALRNVAISIGLAVVVSIDDQLPLDRNGLVFGVIEVDSPAQAARRLLPCLIQNRGTPDHRHFHGGGIFALLQLGIWRAPPELRPVNLGRLAAGCDQRGQSDDCKLGLGESHRDDPSVAQGL